MKHLYPNRLKLLISSQKLWGMQFLLYFQVMHVQNWDCHALFFSIMAQECFSYIYNNFRHFHMKYCLQIRADNFETNMRQLEIKKKTISIEKKLPWKIWVDILRSGQESYWIWAFLVDICSPYQIFVERATVWHWLNCFMILVFIIYEGRYYVVVDN